MSKPVARKTDRHEGTCSHGDICCPHSVSGTIIEGGTSTANSLPIARLNDNVEHNCPHCGTGYISEGSPNDTSDGKPIARLGDTVTYPGGSGKIVSASPNIYES